MNMKKLLATTAIAALAATSANALDLVYNDLASIVTDVVVNDAASTLASEFDLSAGVDTVLGLQATTTTPLPAGDNVLLTVNLPAGVVFDGAVPAGSVVNDDDAGFATTDDFNNITVSTGGANGASTVTFLIEAGADTQIFNLALPVTVSTAACTSAAPITIALTTESGTAIEGGSASLEDAGGDVTNAFTCASAVNSSGTGLGVVADTASTENSQLALPGYVSFVAGSDGSGAFTPALDTATTVTVGTINASITGGLQASFSAGADALVVGDINEVTFTITLSDADGIAAVALLNGADLTGGTALGAAVPTSLTGADTYNFTINGGDLTALTDGTPDAVLVTLATGAGAPAAALANITVAVTASEVDFTSATLSDEDFVLGSLETIERQAQIFGPFDWVGDASKSSRNLFRATGAAAAATVGEVTFTNSSTGKNGTFPFTLNTVNGEGQVFSNTDLEALNPDFGRADVTFSFFSTTPTDMDRLLLRGEVLSNFGNTTNGDD